VTVMRISARHGHRSWVPAVMTARELKAQDVWDDDAGVQWGTVRLENAGGAWA